MAGPRDFVDDCGIDDDLPENPLLSVLEAGTHPKYLGPLLVFSPDGNPVEGNRYPVHNARGVFHNLRISSTGLLKLGDR